MRLRFTAWGLGLTVLGKVRGTMLGATISRGIVSSPHPKP